MMKCVVRLSLDGKLASEREEEVTVFKLEEREKAREDMEKKISGSS